MNDGLAYEKLVPAGRAKAIGVPWSSEENEALCLIAQATHKPFCDVAPFVRNGVLTLEDYEKAVKKGLTPPTEEKAREIAKDKFQDEIKTTGGKKKKK